MYIALAVLVLWTCEKPPPKKSASLASRIELAAGNVSVRQAGGKWERAIAGLLLRHGTEVKVGPGDRALIRMDDGSSVFLRHGTSIKLEPEGLTLSAGEVWIDAPGQDQKPASYRAGEVAVSAAGAGLDLRRAGELVEVYVARGFGVVAAPGGRTEVQAGEKVRIQGKGAPRVAAVSFWEDWTGGMADRTLTAGVGGEGTGRIYAIDRARPGSPPQELEVRAQHVRVLIREGISRTIVDQRFFNPGSAPVEGYYWFTIPEGAAVDRFALDVNGTLVDGEVAERKQARGAYEAAIRQAVDPALLEWIDGRTYRARIFPIPGAGERRVVISYLEALATVDNKVHYIYPMGGAPRVQEFALEVDLGEEGEGARLATTADARVEDGGKKVSMRRSGFKPQGDFLLEMAVKQSEPLKAMRVESGRAEAAYVALRYMPDVDWSQVKQVPGNVVVVVDTSAGGDDADRQLRSDVAEAILRALSTGDRFALMAADLKPRVLYPRSGLAKADEASVGKALEALSAVSRGGATDLGGLFDVALRRLHGSVQPAVVYIGDGRPTVGELEGDLLAGRLTRSMAGSAARLFTIAAGSRCNHALLARLARIGGGRTFRVDLSQQAVQEALRFVGQLKTPTITDLKMDVGAGLDQVFSTAAGKVSRGQEVMLLARTHHPLPKTVKVTGRLAGKAFKKEYSVKTRSGSDHAYVPKLWARQYLTHLLGTDREKNRGTIIRLGLDYALMTPFTSFLVLESEAAYQRYGIQRRPRHPYWGIVPHAALELGAALPLALFGCAKGDEAAPATVAREEVAARGPVSKSMPVASTPQEKPRSPEPEPAAMDEVTAGRGRRMARPAKAVAANERPKGAETDKGLAADRLAGKDAPDDAEENRPRVIVLKVCSDASRRSLAHRRAIWEGRLDLSGGMAGRVAVYRRARASCELPHWRDRKAMLDLLQDRVQTPADARLLLQAVADRKGREFVQRRLLTRAVSGEMSQALQLAETVDWSIADAALAKAGGPEQRVTQLRELCQKHPRSAGCAIRLIQALVATGKTREALSVALKMRADGLATPALMQQVGDLLADAGRPEEAMRVYSEIVEFSPDDPAARRLLGDIYLRHRWFQAAYRQYRTLTQATPDAPLALLRLAAAASGTGRGDEALRLERKVASGEGEPGPRDPRRWARMWSAARIARLMLADKGGKESVRQSMERSLRRLQVLSSPGVLFLLTWEDLGARLTMDLKAGQPINWSDRIDASPTGLVAITTSTGRGGQVTASVSRSGVKREVRFEITTIRWDGGKMHVSSQDGKVGAQPVPKNVTVP
jgi:Flp pilus assembly protein TadD